MHISIQLKDLDIFKSVPHLVTDIVKGNISALETALADSGDIQKPIQLGKYSEYLPLQLALGRCCFPSVKWLVDHCANLNDE